MPDELVRLHLKEPDLLAVGVLCTDTARHASSIHRCMPTSAGLLGQAFAATFGVAGLLGRGRINLQVTCDGPIKGLLVDADSEGRARGYVKNPAVNFLSSGGGFEPGAALGGDGLLSVLRELKDGEYYRGSVALEKFDLAQDLERYYRESEQIDTAVVVRLEPDEGTPLGYVSAVLIQSMPDAHSKAISSAREVLSKGLAKGERALDLLRPLMERFPGDWDVLAQYPLQYECGCSADRVIRAVMAMGRAEIEDMLETQGHAVATCAFCGTVYEVSGDKLRQILEQ